MKLKSCRFIVPVSLDTTLQFVDGAYYGLRVVGQFVEVSKGEHDPILVPMTNVAWCRSDGPIPDRAGSGPKGQKPASD